MRYDDFDDFFSYYVGKGLAVGLVCAVIIGLFALIIFLDKRHNALKTNNLYAAASGAEPVNEKDSDSLRFYESVKALAKAEREGKQLSHSDYIAIFEIMNKAKKTNLFFNHEDDLRKLAHGEVSYDELKKELPEWKFFLSWVSLVSFAVISFCACFHFVLESVTGRESLFDWPWKKWWTYFFLLYLSPFLVIAMSYEILFRLLRITRRVIIRAWRRLFAIGKFIPGETQLDPINDEKKNALQIIEEAKAELSQTQNAWVKFWTRDIEEKDISLHESVEIKREQLSSLGKRISQEQKTYAALKKELEEWKKGFAGKMKKSEEHHLGQLKKLLSFKRVMAVKVVGEVLHIFTDMLHIRLLGSKYEIGMMDVSINMNNGNIVIRNLCSTHREGRDHPYASRGDFCWGTLHSVINTAINEKEFLVAFQHMMVAMESAAGDNASDMKNWKEVI